MAIQFSPKQLSTKSPPGATIETAYVGRAVKVYGVLETEINSIAMFNFLSTVFFSISASLPSIAIGIWANAAFAEKVTAEGKILSSFVAPVLCGLAIVFFCLAIWAIRSKGSTIDVIKEETKTEPPK